MNKGEGTRAPCVPGERDAISHTQLTSLVWAGVLAPAAELLPALTLPLAGKGAWLVPAAAIPPVLAGGWLMGRLRPALDCLGCPVRRGVLLLYLVWGELLLALRLRLCAQRLLGAGRRDGELWFFLIALAGLVLWIGMGRLSAFARAGQLFFGVLLAAGGVVLALSLFQVRLTRVLPLWKDDVVPLLRSVLPGAGVLGWGLYGGFLTGALSPPAGRGRWYWPVWGAGGCLVLTAAQWIILGSLGPALALRLDNPFFTLAKSVGVEGAFQRVESVIIALWTFADLAMAGVLLFALRAVLAREGLNPGRERGWAAALLVLAAVLALAAFPRQTAQQINRMVVPWGNLVLGLIVPGLVTLWSGLWKGRGRGGISCGKKQE